MLKIWNLEVKKSSKKLKNTKNVNSSERDMGGFFYEMGQRNKREKKIFDLKRNI
jgi:hypothetical protein